MRILMIGSGGREHALIRKLKESPRCEAIYCAPGNGGISKDAVCVDISAEDIDGVVSFAKENQIDLVFVAPDDPFGRRHGGCFGAGGNPGVWTAGKTPLSSRAARCFPKI